MNANEAKVLQVIEKEFEGRKYYKLIVMTNDNQIGKLSCAKPKSIGQVVKLVVKTKESDMTFAVRVVE